MGKLRETFMDILFYSARTPAVQALFGEKMPEMVSNKAGSCVSPTNQDLADIFGKMDFAF